MKLVIIFFLMSFFSYAGPKAQQKTLPVSKLEEVVKNDKMVNDKLKKIKKETEDCDEKAKKKVEIKPESISLTGNTGCSLDDIH
jgi:hypothetical protein